MKEKMIIERKYNKEFCKAIDKIVVKIHSQNENSGAKLFVFNGAGKEAGTTTVAKNVAVSLAASGWKTAFVDCDLRNKNKESEEGESEAASLSALSDSGKEDYERIIRSTDIENLDYVCAGSEIDNPVQLLCSNIMKKFILYLRDKYDYVILDSTSVNESNDIEILLPYIDKYLFVVSLNKTKKKEFASARIQLADFEDKYMGVVVNNMEITSFGRNKDKSARKSKQFKNKGSR